MIDQVIEGLAAGQHGVFAAWQLERRGINRRSLLARCRDGRLRRLHRGVYATGPYLSLRGRLMAAALAYGPQAAISHIAAGVLHDLMALRGAVVDVTLPQRTRNRRGIRSHQARLLPQDHTFIDGIPVTSLARTLLDLSAIREVLTRSNGHRGHGPLTALLTYDPTAAAAALSELERLFLDLLRAHGIPMPLTNVLVDGYLVDAYWPEVRPSRATAASGPRCGPRATTWPCSPTATWSTIPPGSSPGCARRSRVAP